MSMGRESRAALIALRDAAPVKDYGGEPSQFVVCGDYIATFYIESALGIEQPTLAVSRADRGPINDIGAVIDEFKAIFGKPVVCWKATYPKRGETVLWVYNSQKKGSTRA